MFTSSTLGILGGLTAIVNIIVQLIKDLFPKVPTKFVTVVISILVCLIYSIMETGMVGSSIIYGIFSGLIVSYAATNGFDTIQDLYNRFKALKGGDNEE